MAKTIGVTLSERILAGLVVDHKLTGPVQRFPEGADDDESGLVELHTDALVDTMFPYLTAMDERIDELQDQIFADPKE